MRAVIYIYELAVIYSFPTKSYSSSSYIHSSSDILFVYISNTERERNIPENIFPELISYQILILYKKLTSNEMKMVRNAIVLDREVN